MGDEVVILVFGSNIPLSATVLLLLPSEAAAGMIKVAPELIVVVPV